MKKILLKILKQFGIEVIADQYVDFEDLHKDIWAKVSGNTMTSKDRIFGLIEAVKYISKNKIEGSIVECGVWRGGSMMAVAETLKHTGDTGRELYLFDTFEGMSEPTVDDADYKDESAQSRLDKEDKNKKASHTWAYSTLETVQAGMANTSYNNSKIHYIKGKVEDTIPGTLPEKIALLRLDTDWYESTRHELNHLFPRLVKGGVLIIDDYGYWKGARKAMDEYIAEHNIRVLLCRMDYTGRIAIKQ